MAYQLIHDIQPTTNDSQYVNAPFDEGKKLLEKAGYRIINLRENAQLRMKSGKDAFISQNGNWVAEDFVYVLSKGIYMTKPENSQIMQNAKKATDAHRNGNEFYLNEKQVEQSLEGAFLIPDTLRAVPTNRFAEEGLTAFAFGEDAQAYGDFLKNAGINEMPIYKASMQDKPFARKLWFGDLGNRSVLSGSSWNLGGGGGMRGVRRASA